MHLMIDKSYVSITYYQILKNRGRWFNESGI